MPTFRVVLREHLPLLIYSVAVKLGPVTNDRVIAPPTASATKYKSGCSAGQIPPSSSPTSA